MITLKDFSEYVCVDNSERLFLKKKGIPYSFVRHDLGFVTWKYKKTKELFIALAQYQEFINNINN